MRTSVILIFVLLFGNFSCGIDGSTDRQDVGLVGTWILVAYEDLEAGTIENSPDNVDEIRIEFSDSVFSGKTGRNDFFGSYSTQNDLLILAELDGTEINESIWGNRFFDSIREAYNAESDDFEINYSLNGEFLKMEYKNGHALLFERVK